MTFSISARCASTGACGVAVSSSSIAVAARCAHVRAGAGVVTTQNVTDPRLGPRGLDLMGGGLAARAALDELIAQTPDIAYRQLALVDRQGGAAVYSGALTLGRHGAIAGQGFAVAGNLLADEAILQAMADAFEARQGDLADRLLDAMQAGLAAGGEAGPVHSAGLLIARDVPWPVADLRVDWHDTDPIGALAALWQRWRPEQEDYVTRALNPAAAPRFAAAPTRP